MSSLSLQEWIDTADQKALLLKMSTLRNMSPGTHLILAASLDQGSRKEHSPQKNPLPPEVYWNENKEIVYRLADGRYKFEDIEYGTCDELPFKDRGDGLAALGTGDDYSMEWNKLSQMPMIFSEKEDDEDDEDEH